MGVGGQRHTPAALPPGRTQYVLYRRLGAENLAPTGIRSPDRPARSESLYRLSYVGHLESKERLRIQPAQLFNFS